MLNAARMVEQHHPLDGLTEMLKCSNVTKLVVKNCQARTINFTCYLKTSSICIFQILLSAADEKKQTTEKLIYFANFQNLAEASPNWR